MRVNAACHYCLMDTLVRSAAARGVDRLNQAGKFDDLQTLSAYLDMSRGRQIHLRSDDDRIADVRDVVARGATLSFVDHALSSQASLKEIEHRARKINPQLVFASVGLKHAIDDFKRVYKELAGSPRPAALDPLISLTSCKPPHDGKLDKPIAMPRPKQNFDALLEMNELAKEDGGFDEQVLVPIEEPPVKSNEQLKIKENVVRMPTTNADAIYNELTRGLNVDPESMKKFKMMAAKMAEATQ